MPKIIELDEYFEKLTFYASKIILLLKNIKIQLAAAQNKKLTESKKLRLLRAQNFLTSIENKLFLIQNDRKKIYEMEYDPKTLDLLKINDILHMYCKVLKMNVLLDANIRRKQNPNKIEYPNKIPIYLAKSLNEFKKSEIKIIVEIHFRLSLIFKLIKLCFNLKDDGQEETLDDAIASKSIENISEISLNYKNSVEFSDNNSKESESKNAFSLSFLPNCSPISSDTASGQKRENLKILPSESNNYADDGDIFPRISIENEEIQNIQKERNNLCSKSSNNKNKKLKKRANCMGLTFDEEIRNFNDNNNNSSSSGRRVQEENKCQCSYCYHLNISSDSEECSYSSEVDVLGVILDSQSNSLIKISCQKNKRRNAKRVRRNNSAKLWIKPSESESEEENKSDKGEKGDIESFKNNNFDYIDNNNDVYKKGYFYYENSANDNSDIHSDSGRKFNFAKIELEREFNRPLILLFSRSVWNSLKNIYGHCSRIINGIFNALRDNISESFSRNKSKSKGKRKRKSESKSKKRKSMRNKINPSDQYQYKDEDLQDIIIGGDFK